MRIRSKWDTTITRSSRRHSNQLERWPHFATACPPSGEAVSNRPLTVAIQPLPALGSTTGTLNLYAFRVAAEGTNTWICLSSRIDVCGFYTRR